MRKNESVGVVTIAITTKQRKNACEWRLHTAKTKIEITFQSKQILDSVLNAFERFHFS